MKKTIITISREFGSGGRTVGKKLSEVLGIAYYDKEIIEKVHDATGFAKDFIAEQGEYSPTKNFFSYAFIGRDVNGVSMNDYVWNAQRKVIIDIAEKGPCVIVGRCADYILRNRSDVLNVFIRADMDYKAKRIVELYGETKDNPKKRLTDKDKKRAINYKYYTDREWGACENYDISINTSAIGIDGAVEMVLDMLKKCEEYDQ